MKTTKIYITADKSKAKVVEVFGNANKTSKETTYKLIGERWVTPLEQIFEIYPNAELINE